MSVRAKFKCNSEKRTAWSDTARIYEFDAVCADEVPENQRFHQYTPSGRLEITVDNPEVKFEIGKEYYLDFTPAPSPAQ